MNYQVQMLPCEVLNGKRNLSDMCPVALATRRTLKQIGAPKSWRVLINGWNNYIRNSRGSRMGTITGVSKFVKRFDAAKDKSRIRPISFNLQLA